MAGLCVLGPDTLKNGAVWPHRGFRKIEQEDDLRKGDRGRHATAVEALDASLASTSRGTNQTRAN